MSPLFGHKDDDRTTDNVAALEAEIDRLDALSLAGLAAEVMAKGFGPGRPGADDDNRTQMHTEMNGFDFALTRKGRAALQRGDVERALGDSA